MLENQLFEMVENFSVKYRQKIQKTIEPLLKCFKCDYFTFYQVTNKGEVNFLSNDIEALNHYFEDKCYRFDRQVRLPDELPSGIFYSRKNLFKERE